MRRSNTFKAWSVGVTVCVAALMIAACVIRLRSDDDQAGSSTSLAQQAKPMATQLEQCRTVKYEEKDALLECQKLWAEKRRQFLDEMSGSSLGPESGTPTTGSLPLVPRKDGSRLPSNYPAVPAQSE
jgi:conjugative transfer region protein TrbK